VTTRTTGRASAEVLSRRFPPNVGGPLWPAEMMLPDCWRWYCAIKDWDWRDARELDALLAAGERVPKPLKPIVEAIRTGTRKREHHRKVNAARIRGAARAELAAQVSYALGYIDLNTFNADPISARRCGFPKHVRARMKAERCRVFEEASEISVGYLGPVNAEAIEKMVRELRNDARRWPKI